MKSLTPQRAFDLAFLLCVVAAFFIARQRHQLFKDIETSPVQLTPECKEKLDFYGLTQSPTYNSSHGEASPTNPITKLGYSAQDIKAIQRGCVSIDDLQGQDAPGDPDLERNFARRYIRGTHTSCDHCHQSLGDKIQKDGQLQPGSVGLASAWSNGGDQYDKVTGILLMYEMRIMQCMINSSNGYKPNVLSPLIRDMVSYSRFLAAARHTKEGKYYPDQGIDEVTVSQTQKKGDDFIRGRATFKKKCAVCHGADGTGKVAGDRVLYPAVAGENAFNKQSRNYHSHTTLPGFICRNMPKGNEGSLTKGECRDLWMYIKQLPRPAGDKSGVMSALWNQLLMRTLPPLVQYLNAPSEAEPGSSN